MAKTKISIVELERLVREGNGVRQIARKLHVAPSSVTKAIKRFKIAITKDVMLHHASEIVDKNINAIDQLQKINKDANEILDLLMRWQRGDTEALRILESQRTVKYGKDGEELSVDIKTEDPRKLSLKAMQEIRGQLNLQLELFKVLYDLEAQAQFQVEVLEAIRDASPEIRDRIVRNLQKAKAIRSTLDFHRR